jgi:hypothetical protein
MSDTRVPLAELTPPRLRGLVARLEVRLAELTDIIRVAEAKLLRPQSEPTLRARIKDHRARRRQLAQQLRVARRQLRATP